jgi:deoxyribodipyrimidine photo-lyase
MKTIHLYWSRRDFRLTDNPALTAAIAGSTHGDGFFLPIFILEDYMTRAEPSMQFGYPQRQFLARALPKFAEHFTHFVIAQGKGAKTLQTFAKKAFAEGYALRVHVNEDVYPDFYSQVEKLKQAHVEIVVYPDQLTVAKETRSGSGTIYSVFTPFKKAVWKSFLTAPVLPRAPLEHAKYVPTAILALFVKQVQAREQDIMHVFSQERTCEVQGEKKHILHLEELAGAAPSMEGWYASEAEAQHRFTHFLRAGLHAYADTRDSLAIDAEEDGTSRMSLALAWGLLSARWMCAKILEKSEGHLLGVNWFSVPENLQGEVHYVSELIWREFYKYLLFHKPELLHEEFQAQYRNTIRWEEDDEALRRFTAWIAGKTGYPIVDAAMMQLARTGWMHNRARMIVASVLTKNLGVDWRWGQEYFRAQLIDLDEASNNGGWQWGASVGADPKPIRIFNPYLQAKNYDPQGAYQKKWLSPERYAMSALEHPLVPHERARKDALKRYGIPERGPVRDF